MNYARTTCISAALSAAACAYLASIPWVSADEGAAEAGTGLTIFVDVGRFGRKNKAAQNMTELHDTYFKQGWTVIDVEPYIENGDLEGFYVTYVHH